MNFEEVKRKFLGYMGEAERNSVEVTNRGLEKGGELLVAIKNLKDRCVEVAVDAVEEVKETATDVIETASEEIKEVREEIVKKVRGRKRSE